MNTLSMRALSMISFTLCSAIMLNAQIPNAGFEDWSTPNGYEDPDGWVTFNSITAPYATYVCTKETPGYLGAACVNLHVESIPGQDVVAGHMETLFPYTERPTQLTGWWKYEQVGADFTTPAAGIIGLTRWNDVTQQEEVVGTGALIITSYQPDWVPFTIPITYFSPEDPDTASIGFECFGIGFYVDGLSFDESHGITSLSSPVISVYPSPADDVLKLASAIPVSRLRVRSLDGRDLGPVTQMGNAEIDIRHLPAGVYLLQVQLANGDLYCERFTKR